MFILLLAATNCQACVERLLDGSGNMVHKFGLRGRDNSLVCFRDWVTKLAHDSSKLTFDLVLTTIWSIWRARNDLLWKGTISHPCDVALRAEEWMLAFRHYHSPSKMVSMQTIQKWSPPDTGFLKCNFDGA